MSITKDSASEGAASSTGVVIPADIVNMVEKNSQIMKSMQGRYNEELKNLRGRINNVAKGNGRGDGGKGGGQNRKVWADSGDNDAADTEKASKKKAKGGDKGNGAGKRKRQWATGRNAWNNRQGKRGKGGGSK